MGFQTLEKSHLATYLADLCFKQAYKRKEDYVGVCQTADFLA